MGVESLGPACRLEAQMSDEAPACASISLQRFGQHCRAPLVPTVVRIGGTKTPDTCTGYIPGRRFTLAALALANGRLIRLTLTDRPILP